MRSRLFQSALLVALAAAGVAAQQYEHRWLRVAPEGEEFAVHMPEPNYRIRRALPFSGGVTLRPVSYEITYRGGLLSVLSFAKSERATPKKLSAFVEGFRHALREGGVRAETLSASESNGGARGAARLNLSAGDRVGTALVYETQKHFYVVLTLAGAEAAAAAEHFQNSFTFDTAGSGGLPLTQPSVALRTPVKAPAPLWPFAGGSMTIGDRAGGGAEAPIRLPGVDRSTLTGKTVVSGGVLNGKAISKPQPAYPPIAKAARASGTVTVQILVDEEGYVIDAYAVSGHPLLQQAAVFAARQTRFEPTLLEGQPVKVSGVITYNFVLG